MGRYGSRFTKSIADEPRINVVAIGAAGIARNKLFSPVSIFKLVHGEAMVWFKSLN